METKMTHTERAAIASEALEAALVNRAYSEAVARGATGGVSVIETYHAIYGHLIDAVYDAAQAAHAAADDAPLATAYEAAYDAASASLAISGLISPDHAVVIGLGA
jgi:hypothetical protein